LVAINAFKEGAWFIAFLFNQLFDQTQVEITASLTLHQMQVLVFPFVQLANDLEEFGIELRIGISFHFGYPEVW
jgi:hypothetical protein